MPRTILVHLNVEAPEDDDRTPDQIADAIEKALESVKRLVIKAPLAEEV